MFVALISVHRSWVQKVDMVELDMYIICDCLDPSEELTALRNKEVNTTLKNSTHVDAEG